MDDQNAKLLERLQGQLNKGETAEEALELAAEILLDVPAEVLRGLLLERAKRSKGGASSYLERFARQKAGRDNDPEQSDLFEAIGSQAGTLVAVKISEACFHKIAREHRPR